MKGKQTVIGESTTTTFAWISPEEKLQGTSVRETALAVLKALKINTKGVDFDENGAAKLLYVLAKAKKIHRFKLPYGSRLNTKTMSLESYSSKPRKEVSRGVSDSTKLALLPSLVKQVEGNEAALSAALKSQAEVNSAILESLKGIDKRLASLEAAFVPKEVQPPARSSKKKTEQLSFDTFVESISEPTSTKSTKSSEVAAIRTVLRLASCLREDTQQ